MIPVNTVCDVNVLWPKENLCAYFDVQWMKKNMMRTPNTIIQLNHSIIKIPKTDLETYKEYNCINLHSFFCVLKSYSGQKTVMTWIENEEKYWENAKHHHLTQPFDYENIKNGFRNIQGIKQNQFTLFLLYFWKIADKRLGHGWSI